MARDEIAKAIYDAPTLDSAWQRIGRWGPDGPAWHRLGDALFVSTVKADLAGQLMVKRDVGGGRFIFAPDGNTFLDKPWAEAIAEFKARGIVKPNELQTLLGDYAQRTVVARELMLQNIQKEVRAQLEKSLREGGTYQQFARAIEEQKVPLGIADTDPSYLKMVFRTNIQSAYGAGRFRAINDPVVMAERPFVEYRTVGDARVREEHKLLHKTVYRADSEEWQRIAPPNSYNCRCSMVPLTKEDVGDAKVLSKPPKAYVPDPDFDTAPVARLPRALAAEAAAPVHPPTPIIQVPAKLEAQPSKRIGETAEQVFGRKLSDDDLDRLSGMHAQLPGDAKIKYTLEERKAYAIPTGNDVIVTDLVNLSGEIRDKDNEKVAVFHRQFYRRNNELVANQELFEVAEDKQGSGLGRELFNAQMDAYEAAGVDRVQLNAAWVGKYVWSKAGFVAEDANQLAGLRRQFNELLAQKFGLESAARIMSKTHTMSDIATTVVNGDKVGKAFLIGLDEGIPMSQVPSKIKRL